MNTDDFRTSSSLPRPILPMPSGSAPMTTGIHSPRQLPSISTINPKKGLTTARMTSWTTDSTAVESSTVMPTDLTSQGTGIVGHSTAVGGPGPTNKRGRKPGPLSKSAREAQRRLNHSIIEKARRTKINDALTTLKQLVPIDYLQTRGLQKGVVTAPNDDTDNNNVNDDGDGEDEDPDFADDDDQVDPEYQDVSPGVAPSKIKQGANTKTSAAAPSKGGKKQEKEFKLEILVRTVVFLQDLLERVGDLEAMVSLKSPVPQNCMTCGSSTANNAKKRKRNCSISTSQATEHDVGESSSHRDGRFRSQSKIARTASSSEVLPDEFDDHTSQRTVTVTSTRSTAPSSPSSSMSHEKRLPSISSWLNDGKYDLLPSPMAFGTFVGTVAEKEAIGNKKIVYPARGRSLSKATSSPSYLPSPPSSTHFDPIRNSTSTQVPFLNLGPASTSSQSKGVSVSPTSSRSLGKSPAYALGATSTHSSLAATPIQLAHTPEDESAASMLLHIASSNSPTISSSPSISRSSRSMSTTTPPSFSGFRITDGVNALPELPRFSLNSSQSHASSHSLLRPHTRAPQSLQTDNQTQFDDRPTLGARQVETPSSILGIKKY